MAGLYTRTAEDREDLVQEIVFQLWKSYGGFSGRASFETWLYRVAMNVAIHQLKREKRRPTTIPLGPAIPHPTIDPIDGMLDERAGWLRARLSELSLLDRGLVLLFLEDKSYAEIAEIVGISESNVGTRLNRIRTKLRKEAPKTTPS